MKSIVSSVSRGMALLLFCLCLPAAALTLEVDGSFANTNAVGFPTSWTWHDTWYGYLPVATAKVERVDGGNALHYYGAGGSDGCALRSRTRHPGRGGDVVTVSFSARGAGEVWWTLYRWSDTGGWIGGVASQSKTLSSAWRTYSATFTLTEHVRTNATFETVIGVTKGTDMYVRDVCVTRKIETTEGLSGDDFETAKTRLGNPEIVQEYVAPGLLALTSLGRYSAAASTAIDESELPAPAVDGRHFAQSSFRLYDFGAERPTDADLVTTLASPTTNFAFAVRSSASSDVLVCLADGVAFMEYPRSELPADFVFSVAADGTFDLTATSLSDSGVVSASGKSDALKTSAASWSRTLSLTTLYSAVSNTQTLEHSNTPVVTLDNLITALAEVENQKEATFPYLAEPLAEFDPVASGWPLVFADEFDGDAPDTAKWEIKRGTAGRNYFQSNGVMHVRTDYAPNSTNLETASFWSKPSFLYGYFEARLKFTTYNGWWAAFWLCSDTSGNPFVDGLEIDIFEDYYMRNTARNKLDHNLHMRGGTLKSWNYNSILPNTHTNWYTIGCKWTPFEITYYLDGKAIAASAKTSHSPYETVTFDAFRHGTGIKPLRAIVSGQIMSTAYGWHADSEGETFPEDYEIDWVRVYSFPGAEENAAPTATMASGAGGSYSITEGSLMDLRVAAAPIPGGAAVKQVHLFDNGYHIATKTNAPWNFSFPMSEAYYAKTRWMNPGRQSVRPDFSGSMHVFSAFAEDEDGNVGHSPTIRYMLEPTVASTPLYGTPQKIPGDVIPGHYDEGGEGVAYHDETSIHSQISRSWRMDESVDGPEWTISSIASGEWVNYTVEVTTSGWYRLDFVYGTPLAGEQSVDVLLDGERIAMLPVFAHASAGFGTDTTATAHVKLPAGRHVLRLVFFGTFNFGRLLFTKLDDAGETYLWTGAAGDCRWTNPANWNGKTNGWDYPYAGDCAAFAADAVILGDLAFGEGKLVVSNEESTALTFAGAISGAVGIDKRGAGALHLKKSNSFTGGFTTLGTSNCEWSVGRYGFSSEVYAYAGGSLGAGKAFFDCDGKSHGSRLHLMSCGDPVTTSIQLSADGIQQGNVVYHDALGKTVTFRERVTTNERYVDSSPDGSPSRIVFEKGVAWNSWSFCNSGIDYVFGGPSSFATWVLYSGATAHLDSPGNDVPNLKLYSGHARAICGAADALGRANGRQTIEFSAADTWIDLGGHDQTVSNLAAFAQVPVDGFGFTSPTPATLRIGGDGAAQVWRGDFVGGAGLEWNPADAERSFTFSNATVKTSGRIAATRGAVRFVGNTSATAADVEIADGAKFEIGDGLVVTCRYATVRGEPLTNGTYRAADLPDSLAGGGALRVYDFVNRWTGTDGEWSDAANWSSGWTPRAGEFARLPSGAKVFLAEPTPRLAELAIGAGATLTVSNWTTRIEAYEVSVSGTLTTPGAFADDAPLCRVWIACSNLTVAAGGAIDLDAKGWAGGRYESGNGSCAGYGPGAPRNFSLGASHGGYGAMGTVSPNVGAIYDDPRAPTLPGSGAFGSGGTAGGGAVRIEASGAVRVDGAIRASGGDARGVAAMSCSGQTCGSGGSVWISCATLAGGGEIRADGGDGDWGAWPRFVWSYLGFDCEGVRAGGGGMIRVECGECDGADGLVVSAGAGIHCGTADGRGRLDAADHDRFRTAADLGTLTFSCDAPIRKLLGKGLTGRLVDVSEWRHDGNLEWSAGHVRFAGDGASVEVTGDLVISNSCSRLEVGGICVRTNASAIADCWAGTNATRLVVGGDLRILGGAALDVRAADTNGAARTEGGEAWGGEVRVGGDLTLGGGAFLYPWCSALDLGAPRFVVGGAFTVELNATVMADRRGGAAGYASSSWNKYFGGPRNCGSGAGGSRRGASHGGRGGVGYLATSGKPHGSTSAAVDDEWTAAFPGAGGGSEGYAEGGDGGGLVYVEARGPIRVDGLVTADGWLGSYNGLGSDKGELGYCTYFGSGAGGGIHLSGASFSGAGTLRARGGNAISGYAGTNGYASACGGGGRIVIATGADVRRKSVVKRDETGTDAEVRRRNSFTGVYDVSGGVGVWCAAGKSGDAPQFAPALGEAGTVRFVRTVPIGLGTAIIVR